MKDLGTIGGNSSAATAINDNDVIVGHGATVTTGNGLRHAFRYSNGIMSDLGTLGGDTSFARDINSIGEIVGESNYPGGGSLNHAFVIRDGVMHDLNSLIDSATGWTLFAANAINDASQITGAGTINGEWHAYLLTPVPEPRGILFAAFGFAAVAKAFYHRHRRGIHDI